jgi:transcriptional regulator with XRE-family HTH domain
MEASDATSAADAYRRAIALGGESWPRRPHALEQLVTALEIGDPLGCAKLADTTAPALPRTRTFVTLALSGLVCATDPASKSDAALVSRLEALGVEALTVAAAEEDDRYQLYDALIDARKGRKDEAGVRRYAEAYLAYASSLPPTEETDLRSARDLSRLRAATALGDSASIVATLEESERAMPSYTASLRLANAYLVAHRPDDAVAAGTRGLAKQPGPLGSIRLLTVRARAELAGNATARAREDFESARSLLPQVADKGARENLTRSLDRELGQLTASGK